MRKLTLCLACVFISIISISAQQLDTIYYDREWRGLPNAIFATYYRVVSIANDPNYKKQFRDYYTSGELRSEGCYIAIDKFDDSKSIFDGEWISYYKSGAMNHKSTFVNGKEHGEHILYYENGLVEEHANLVNGKLDGVLTQFNLDGEYYTQTEYADGVPKYRYYTVVNRDNYNSKFWIEDNTPICESPNIEELKHEYIDGDTWKYYMKNGLRVAMTSYEVRDDGRYFMVPIVIENNSTLPVDFNTENISATLVGNSDDNQTIEQLNVYSADEYMQKVRRLQNWAMALNILSEGVASSGAGYSTSVTNVDATYNDNYNIKGGINAYGSTDNIQARYSANGSIYGNSYLTTTTQSYDRAVAYQAHVLASDRIDFYNNFMLDKRVIKDEGYLKHSTLYPGDIISGYIYIQRKKGEGLNITLGIENALYVYPWGVE